MEGISKRHYISFCITVYFSLIWGLIIDIPKVKNFDVFSGKLRYLDDLLCIATHEEEKLDKIDKLQWVEKRVVKEVCFNFMLNQD